MNILLSRILTYLNGTLFHDFHYKICTFVIFHYLEMEDMSEEKFLELGSFKKEELYAFIALLGFNQYEEFRETLVNHHQTRLNQIRVRMLGVDSRDFLKKWIKIVVMMKWKLLLVIFVLNYIKRKELLFLVLYTLFLLRLNYKLI